MGEVRNLSGRSERFLASSPLEAVATLAHVRADGHDSTSSTPGSCTSSLIRTRNRTASLPSTSRWS